MTDLVERLRDRAQLHIDLEAQAADEIERLQAEVSRLRNETGIGALDAELQKELAEMTDLAEDWAIRCKEAQHQLRALREELGNPPLDWEALRQDWLALKEDREIWRQKAIELGLEVSAAEKITTRLANIIMDEYPSTDCRYIYAEKQL
jgi:hypothetical protein